MFAILHTDGSAKPNPGSAAIGIVIFGEDGNKLDVHAQAIGFAGSNLAEYKALHEGLKRAKNLGVTKLLCKTDSRNLVKFFHEKWRRHDNLQLFNEMENIKKLAKDFDEFNITHIDRKYNKEADKLARIGLLQGLHEYQTGDDALKGYKQEVDSVQY